MGQTRSNLIALAACAALSACDYIHGVNRWADLAEMPPLDCVERALIATPGVEEVQEWAVEGGRTLTHEGFAPPDRTYYFRFRGAKEADILGVVSIHRSGLGDIRFSNTLLEINRRPPQHYIDATRPVMFAIERQLTDMCGMSELASNVTEHCSGVTCAPVVTPE